MLILEDATVGERLRDLSVGVEPGQVVAVVGLNGAGKSTLIRAALGLERLTAGRVLLAGGPIERLRPRQRAEHLGWLPQTAARPEGLTVLDVVAAARFRFREGRRTSEAQAARVLERSGLAALSDRRLQTLSGGERQRVSLAALDAQEAAIWLLDEPGNHLDPAAQIGAWRRLADEVLGGRGVVVVTHDVTLLDTLRGCDARVLALQDGGSPWCVPLESADLAERLGGLLQLEVRQIQLDGRPRLVVAGGRS